MRGRKRDLILDAAEKVFREKGFHLATLDEIASRAGVAKGTIYLYFEDKLDLFLSAIERRFRQLIGELEGIRSRFDDPVEAVEGMIDVLFKFASSAERLIRHITPEKLRKPPPGKLGVKAHMEMVREKIFKPTEEVVEVLSECVREGQARGVFKGEIDPKLAAVALISMIRGVVFSSKIGLPDLEIGAAKGSEQVKALFLKGLGGGMR